MLLWAKKLPGVVRQFASLLVTPRFADQKCRLNSTALGAEVFFSKIVSFKRGRVVSAVSAMMVLAVMATLFLWGGGARSVFKVKVPAGSIESVEFNAVEGELRLRYADKEIVNIDVDSSVKTAQYYLLEPPSGEPDTLRFLSKEFYASLGQRNDGLFVFSRDIRPDDIQTDPNNRFAATAPAQPIETAVDASLIAIRGLTNRYNVVSADKPVCASADARQLLQGLRNGACYIACSGISIIADQLLPAPSRVVLLNSRTDALSANLSFIWSEWHTALEIYSEGQWYLADPTYGLAYVKNRQGRRLNTESLIRELAEGRAAELTFGVLYDDEIRSVSGDVMNTEQPTLAALYYTPDKRPTYLAISQPGTLAALASAN